MTVIFWLSFMTLFYIYGGYPLLLWLWWKKPFHSSGVLGTSPNVSILLSAFNEEKTLAKKLENLLSLDYPKEKCEILVGSDGATDGTNTILASYAGKGVQSVLASERRGKAGMLNRLASRAKGEILILTDARQRVARDAIRHLVRRFSDPDVGCASGELFLENANGSVGKGLGLYWEYEKFIRRKESEVDSVIGATGALYAVRRHLYHRIPEETILDDLYLPMKVVEKGYRTVFEEKARVYDDASPSSHQEYERKVRTLAGNYQSFMQLSGMLNPFRCRVALQFISHKLLRILAPFFLVGLFAANGFLSENPFYRVAFLGQILFYGGAVLGCVLPQRLKRFFSAPYVFCLLNLSALVGFYRYVTGRQGVTWRTES